MTPEQVITIAQEALKITALLICVALIPALLVGLLVSVFQAATQINEMTLSFIPKLLVMLIVLAVAGPWMLGTLMSYSRRLIESIPFLIG